jgi:hypothetical protein
MNGWEAMDAVMESCPLSGTRKLVLLGIAKHCPNSHPGVGTLARYAGVTKRAVQYMLEDLEAAGWVTRNLNAAKSNARADRRTNDYVINWSRFDGVKPLSPRDGDGVKPASPRGEASFANGVKPLSPEQTHEPTREPTQNTRALETPDAEEGDDEMRVTVGDDGFTYDEQTGLCNGVATDDMVATTASRQIASAEEQQIFDAWVQSLPEDRRARVKLTAQRRQKIRARLREYPLPDLLDAVRGWVNDPWPDRPLQNDLAILLRDGAQVEKFRDLWQLGVPRRRVRPKGYQAIDNAFADLHGNGAGDLASQLGWGNGHHVIEAQVIEEPR